MTKLRTAFLGSLLALAAASFLVHARSAPPRMMTNVYLLAQAGAILDICVASPDAARFPAEKSRELESLSTRLTEVVRLVATHYGDGALPTIYASTKAEIAADPKLKFHVKSNLQYCGERLMGEMRAYVAENETLINTFIKGARLDPPARK